MAQRLDHRMLLRLCFVMILVVGVTGLVKSYALRQDAPRTTPGLAYRYLFESQSSKGGLPPGDGWGNPFFWMGQVRLLFSAGLDEHFHTPDDLIFVKMEASCTPQICQWFRSGIEKRKLNPKTLPQGLKWNSRTFEIEGPQGICSIPDLSGSDGLYGTEDDLFSNIQVLRAGKPPKRMKKPKTP
jgi:hypothetical protein